MLFVRKETQESKIMQEQLMVIGYQLLLLKAQQEVYALVEDPKRQISHIFEILEKMDQYLTANPWLLTDYRFVHSLTRLYNQIPLKI